jgi:hypothetical protein
VRPSGYNVTQEVPTQPAPDQCMGMQMQPGIGECAGLNKGFCVSTCIGHSDCETGFYCANTTGENDLATDFDVPHGLGLCQPLERCMLLENDAIDCHCNASDVSLGNGCVAMAADAGARWGFGQCYAGMTLGANVSCSVQKVVVGDPPRCPTLAWGGCEIACMSHDDCVGVPTVDQRDGRTVITQDSRNYCRAPSERGGVGTVGHVCGCV